MIFPNGRVGFRGGTFVMTHMLETRQDAGRTTCFCGLRRMRPNEIPLSRERRTQCSTHPDPPAARRLQWRVRRRAASSGRSSSARDGAEHHACPSAEPERARDDRNSRTRSRPQEDSRRRGTAGSGGDGARRRSKRHARGPWCAAPGYHDRQRADNGRCSEPEISEVIACVDGTHEPKEHRHARKEHRHE